MPPQGLFAAVSAGGLAYVRAARRRYRCLLGQQLWQRRPRARPSRTARGANSPPLAQEAPIRAGVRVDGSMACWGSDEFGQATPPEGKFASVSAGGFHTCGVRVDGFVVCWGYNEDGQAIATGGAIRFRQRWRLSHLWGNGLTDSSLAGAVTHSLTTTCFERWVKQGHRRGSSSPSVRGAITRVGLLLAGTVICWGSNLWHLGPRAHPTTAAGGEFHCHQRRAQAYVRRTNGRLRHLLGLRCLMARARHREGNSFPLAHPEATVVGSGQTAPSLAGAATTVLEGGRTGPTGPAEGGIHLCRRRGMAHVAECGSNGSVTCWSRSHYYQASLEGEFTSVSAGRGHTCGVMASGSVALLGRALAWSGPHRRKGSSLPSAQGDGYTCGVRLDGSVACWGADLHGETHAAGGGVHFR